MAHPSVVLCLTCHTPLQSDDPAVFREGGEDRPRAVLAAQTRVSTAVRDAVRAARRGRAPARFNRQRTQLTGNAAPRSRRRIGWG
jgi:uncharacterized protein (DUF2252 family)